MALWGNNDNIVSSGTVTLNYTSRVVTGAGTSFGANAAVAAGLSPAGFSTVFIVAPTGTAVGDTIIVDRWPVGSGSTITGIGATSVSFASTITKAVAAGQNVLFFGARQDVLILMKAQNVPFMEKMSVLPSLLPKKKKKILMITEVCLQRSIWLGTN